MYYFEEELIIKEVNSRVIFPLGNTIEQPSGLNSFFHEWPSVRHQISSTEIQISKDFAY